MNPARAAAALTFGLGVAVLGCGRPWLPVATEADLTRAQARWPDVTVDDLNHGRALVLRRCSNCHLTPSPSERTAAQWPAQVAEMAERAGLQPAEHGPLTRYMEAFARDQVTPPR